MANAKEQLKAVNAAIAKLKAQKGVASYIKLAKMQARLKGKVTGGSDVKAVSKMNDAVGDVHARLAKKKAKLANDDLSKASQLAIKTLKKENFKPKGITASWAVPTFTDGMIIAYVRNNPKGGCELQFMSESRTANSLLHSVKLKDTSTAEDVKDALYAAGEAEGAGKTGGKKMAGASTKSKSPDDIFKAMRAAVMAKVKTLNLVQRRKLHDAFLRWFDYNGSMSDTELKSDKRLVDELMDADPMLAEGGLSDFLTKHRIISKKVLDA